MRCLLAVDAGGTKCEAVLVDELGHVLGWGRRDYRHRPGEHYLGGLGRSQQTVSEAVAEALSGVSGIEEIHIAGGAADSTFQGFRVVRHPVREQDGPMQLVSESFGLVVLAGTGAFVYGRAEDGRELLLDGLGPLYGDHGGAFQIGLAAIRASARADWHSRYATSLASPIVQACKGLAGNPEGFSMVTYMVEARDRSEIASLAGIVDKEAESGDGVARSILMSVADDIAETIRCVVDRLDLATDALPLIGTGGVAVNSITYWRRVTERVQEFAPNLKPILVRQPPVLGMILSMASQLAIDKPSFRETLLAHRRSESQTEQSLSSNTS